MQQEIENLQQKNLSFGEPQTFKALINERQSIQQNQFVNDNGVNHDQNRYTNQNNKNQDLSHENQNNQSNYNFGALRNTQQSNQMDFKKLQEFMDLNHTGGQKSLRGNGSGSRRSSFAEDVQKEIQEFSAGKQQARRNRTGSNQSRNSNTEKQDRKSVNNMVEYPKKVHRDTEVKMQQRRSDDRYSDDKLSFFLKNVRDDEHSASSLSKKNKDNHHDSFMVKDNQNALYYPPFIDDKLSNINDTLMSNARNAQANNNVVNNPQQPKISNQAIYAIANVFDNIDILNPNKDSIIQQVNDSQINAKFLAADPNEDDHSDQNKSPTRESYKQPKQNDEMQFQNQKDKQVNPSQLNDETGSFAKDGYINFGERNSLRDAHFNDFYNLQNLPNTQNRLQNIQQNEKAYDDQYEYNQYQNYQRQTFNPNDQAEIMPIIENIQQNIIQVQKPIPIIEIKQNVEQMPREEFKIQVVNDINSLTKQEKEKQLELMMDQLMVQRQNYFNKQQVNQQQVEQQNKPQIDDFKSQQSEIPEQNYQKQQLQEKSEIQQPNIVENQLQNQIERRDPFQDQFKKWQAQKNLNIPSKSAQNYSDQQMNSNIRSSSKISDQKQINQEFSQNWETLASQTKITPKIEIQQFNPVQDFNYQQYIQTQTEQQIEKVLKTEIKAIKVDLRENNHSKAKNQEKIETQIENPIKDIFQYEKPLNQNVQLHPQYQNQNARNLHSQNNNAQQQIFSPQRNNQESTVIQSEFGASRNRIEQQKQPSRSGSRMSQSGRIQKFADGRQSRSGSRQSFANQDDQPSFTSSNISLPNNAIPSISLTKTVLQNNNIQQISSNQSQTLYNTQIDPYLQQRPVAGSNREKMIQQNNQSQPSDQTLDQTMELKRKQMAEDQAKAFQAQKDLEMNARKRRQEEQQKLLDDLKNSKLFQPSQKNVADINFRQQIVSPQRMQKQEGRKISVTRYHDDEFNDIDESTDKGEASSTIRASGPQNHRRYDQYQGPLYQRNKKPIKETTINHPLKLEQSIKNPLLIQKSAIVEIQKNGNLNVQYNQTKNAYKENENSQSELSQMPFGTVISSSQQQSNENNSITLLNNVDTSLQNLTDNKTQLISHVPIQNQQFHSNFQRNRDTSKTNIYVVEKENQVNRFDNDSQFNRVIPSSAQNYKTNDSKLQSNDRRNSGSATQFFQALSKKRSESRGNTQNSSGRNSRSDALRDVMNRSNSRGDRFRFFGKKDSETRAYENANQNNQEQYNSQLSTPTLKQINNESNKQFYQEFKNIISRNIQNGQNRNLVMQLTDVMKDLGFLHQNIQLENQRETRLNKMLEQQRDNLNLISNSGVGSNGLSKIFNEIIDNFFNICCSILGLQVDSKQVQKMDQKLLDSVLNQIDIQKDDQDVLILEQLVMIKILINRQSTYLNDSQQKQIQSKFINLAINRNNYKQNQTPVPQQKILSPRIFNGSRQINVPEQPKNVNIQVLHPQSVIQQNNISQRPWQSNRPLSRAGRPQSRAGSGVRHDSNAKGQSSNQSIVPQQSFPNQFQSNNQEFPRNNNVISNSSITHLHPQQKQINDALNYNNRQALSPFRQQNDQIFAQNSNLFQEKQKVFLNSPAKIVKFNQINPVSGSQNCPSEAYTIRDSYNTVDQTADSYIGARETQRVADFSSQASPTPLFKANNTDNYKKNFNLNNYGSHQLQNMNKSPIRDSNNPLQKPQQQPNQQLSDIQKQNQRNLQQNSYTSQNNKQTNNEVIQNKQSFSQNQQSSFNENIKSQENMLNDSFGPINHTQTVSNEQIEALKYQQNRSQKPSRQTQPICVLKIELEDSHVKEIQVFQGEDPNYVVKRFADMFNLSDEAILNLNHQIRQQILIFNSNHIFQK